MDLHCKKNRTQENAKTSLHGVLIFSLKIHKRFIESSYFLYCIILNNPISKDKRCLYDYNPRNERTRQKEGVTEQLKATDQMKWVQRMNNIRECIIETVYSDVVFV